MDIDHFDKRDRNWLEFLADEIWYEVVEIWTVCPQKKLNSLL